ncbi:MAG TPA: PQQ-dependent sugar dehydrogenase [Ignavibacteria bacterium]|nr:PQQ-dependent sugar dehydrogenase [Ignavibacteria bacterium]
MKIKLLILLAIIFISNGRANAQYGLQDAFPSMPTFALPIDITTAGDGTNRLFIAQQRGIIYVFENTPTVSTRKVFLDISDRVSPSGSETGLLGLTFHPNYETNGYFYVDYTTPGTLTTRIARYQVSSNPDSAIKNSELILLTISQPFSNHNGGCIKFGMDGYLYIAMGDGGSGGDPQGNGQNTSVLLGKILRIDVNSTSGGNNYAIPPSNYFADSTGSQRKEIFAWGMRNPWRFSFDSVTSRLWCGDVGQNTREEVDIIENGKNYGWNKMEGFLCYPSPSSCDTAGRKLVLPIVDYPRSDGISITGGYVYRQTEIPLLTGKYIYADYGSGRIWSLQYNGPGNVVNTLLYDSPYAISSFGIDNNNVMYCLSYGSSGRVYKLTGPPTTVTPINNEIPNAFDLMQNYPNPFNPTTKINFAIPSASNVSLQVFDMSGRVVAELMNNEFIQPGNYSREFDATGLASGIYIYKLSAGNFVSSKRMALVK